MVAEELLALLRCPETRQPLTVATPELIARLESLRAANKLRDRSGNPYSGSIESGLVTADGAYFYPIRDKIPVMITAEAIDLRAAFT
jgi:uncharacterized protein YbaR (Trm112 family)